MQAGPSYYPHAIPINTYDDSSGVGGYFEDISIDQESGYLDHQMQLENIMGGTVTVINTVAGNNGPGPMINLTDVPSSVNHPAKLVEISSYEFGGKTLTYPSPLPPSWTVKSI
jgi:hypothetical protein